MPSHAFHDPSAPRSTLDVVLTNLTVAACVALLLYKAVLITRLNINWDEFFYLSFVHTLARGELTLVLQGAFTHLFGWLPAVAENEATQVVAARSVMVMLLALTAWLIGVLGRHWLRGFSAVAPVLVYLSLVPVTVHGGSFRADSMLAPLLMGALVVMIGNAASLRRQVLAGVLLGAALALTIKVALFAPLLAAFLFFALREQGNYPDSRIRWRPWLSALVLVGVITGLVAAALIGAHAMSLAVVQPTMPSAVAAESVSDFALRAATTTLLETPWFPLWHVFQLYVDWQPVLWLLVAIGFIVSVACKQYSAATLALALLPIAFYRNSFPYFYVVMMAPPSILSGFAIQSTLRYLARRRMKIGYAAFALALWLGLAYQPLAHLRSLWVDRQSVQREIIAGAHQIFPEPVNYIDRCGMIGSFRKVNFFMSTWGISNYRAAGTPVMPGIAAQARPAFLIMNSPALMTGRSGPNGLLEMDRAFLQRTYSRYWGPIKVAGGTGRLSTTDPTVIYVPFAAEYRVDSPVSILIDGRRREPGDVIAVSRSVEIRPVAGLEPQEPIAVKLVLATARPPPPSALPPQEIFTRL